MSLMYQHCTCWIYLSKHRYIIAFQAILSYAFSSIWTWTEQGSCTPTTGSTLAQAIAFCLVMFLLDAEYWVHGCTILFFGLQTICLYILAWISQTLLIFYIRACWIIHICSLCQSVHKPTSNNPNLLNIGRKFFSWKYWFDNLSVH